MIVVIEGAPSIVQIKSNDVMLQGTTVEYFPTPFHAMWDVLLQAADGPDSQFFTATLSHRVMTYILFITFIVAVPVLFSNFLVSLSCFVYDTLYRVAVMLFTGWRSCWGSRR